MVDIDRSVKAYYEDKQLSEQQLQHLLALQSEQDSPLNHHAASAFARLVRLRWPFALTLAAGLVLAVLFIGDWAAPNITARVAQEVAMNHNKALAVEYPGDSYPRLSRAMDKLDFVLLAPRLLAEDTLRLLGARYCSIQGQLAAQLKLVDESGRIYTLYQTRLNDELKAISREVLQHEKVTIRLWDEQGILYGLAVAELDGDAQ